MINVIAYARSLKYPAGEYSRCPRFHISPFQPVLVCLKLSLNIRDDRSPIWNLNNITKSFAAVKSKTGHTTSRTLHLPILIAQKLWMVAKNGVYLTVYVEASTTKSESSVGAFVRYPSMCCLIRRRLKAPRAPF